ncbi:MAG: hypothetical protein JNM68_01065 [Dinghuibacter sp.]|nr:hypothetical protein [Dinghuibacter sp.]
MKKSIHKLNLKKRVVIVLNGNDAQHLHGGREAASLPLFTCNGSCEPTCFCPSPPFTLGCPVKP